MAAPRYLLVANPSAQSGRAAQRIEDALARMQRRGLAVRCLPTRPRGTPGLVAQAVDEGGWDAVVCLGGDGTFAEVAKGVLASRARPPLGMLPAGTANDQGRSFGISSDEAELDRNLDILEAGHVVRLDAGRLRRLEPAPQADELVFHSAGFGMQADILRERNADRELVGEVPLLREVYRDQLVYLGAAVKGLLASYVEPVKFDAEVIADGERHLFRGLTDLVVKATAFYGGAWVLARESRPDDGRFELVPFEGRRDIAARAVHSLALAPLAEDDLAALGLVSGGCLSAARFSITLHRPEQPDVVSQVDGEEWRPGRRFELEVEPRALRLVVPADFEPYWRSERTVA